MALNFGLTMVKCGQVVFESDVVVKFIKNRFPPLAKISNKVCMVFNLVIEG